VHNIQPSAATAKLELLLPLFDQTSTLIAYWDRNLRCRVANRAYELWFGVSLQQLIGSHLGELLGPQYEEVRPYVEAVLRGEPQEFERDYVDPTGGPPRPALMRFIPDVVENEVRGYYVLGTDVSAVKRAELALRESEERFRLTIDEAPIGMALVAPDGRFLRVNRVFCCLVGYSAEELSGMPFHVITHPDDLDSDLAMVAQLERGEICRYQYSKRYIRKDGTIVDVMLSASVVRDSSGAPIHYIAQFEDITAQKRAETEQRLLAAMGPVFAASLDFEETLARIAELVASELADTCMIDVIETEDEPRTLRAVGNDPALVAICEGLEKTPCDRSRPCLMRHVYETRRPVLVQHPTPAQFGALGSTQLQL
jgi:PAS domain S-box-containing protein